MAPSNLMRGVASSAAGTAFSRVAGATRDIVLARVLGATATSDAFWMAFTIPSVFRRFVADEGLTGVMVPALTDAETRTDRETAQRLAGGLFVALILAGLAIWGAGALGAEWLVWAFASGFEDDPEQFALTVRLTRWMLPFVIFVSLVSWCEGLLNIRDHYFVPKIAPGLVSAGLVAGGLLASDEDATIALVIGLLVGGLVHFLVCIPPVLRRWGPLRLGVAIWRTPRFRAVLAEMGKVVAIGIFAQLNILVLRRLASELPTGSVTQYWYANRVVDLAQGVVAVAVGSAMLPPIARAVAAGDWDRFEDTFVSAARLAAVVLIPAAALLIVISDPIVATLFRHGEFSGEAARGTAACLRHMIPFMLAVAGIGILKKPYFALERRDVLLVVGALGVLLTWGLGWVLSLRLGGGVEGLAQALSLSTTIQLIVYGGALHRVVGARVGARRLVSPLLRMTLAAAPAAALAWLITSLGAWEDGPTLLNAALLGGAVITAALVYLAGAWMIGVRQELSVVMSKLRRR